MLLRRFRKNLRSIRERIANPEDPICLPLFSEVIVVTILFGALPSG